MIIDARCLPDGMQIEAEIVIVGGGPAGIVLALEAAAKGATVCLIEAGGLHHAEATQALSAGLVEGDPYPALRETRLFALGGTSQLWAGWCRALDPIDFTRRAEIDHSGWPIDRQILQPFYQDAMRWFRLGAFDDDAHAWQEKAGCPAFPLAKDMISPALFHQSKVRFGNVYRRALDEAKNLKVYLHAPVIRAYADAASNRVERLSVRTLDAKSLTIVGRQFVLAAGGIENARLLLASGEDPGRAIGNRHGIVGCYFTEHAFVEAGFLILNDSTNDVRFYFPQGKYRARSGFAISNDILEREGLLRAAIFLKSAVENHAVFDDPSVKAMIELTEQWRGRKVPGGVLDLARVALRRPDRLAIAIKERLWRNKVRPDRWRLRGIFETAPQPANRVQLSSVKDALGRQLPELRWRMGALDLRSIRRAHQVLDEALRARGIGRLQITIPDDDQAWRAAAGEGGKHHMGTTRMHDDPKAGVVDRNLQVHGVSNLFVVSSSVFPTGGYANPTLTIVALSIRLADYLTRNPRK